LEIDINYTKQDITQLDEYWAIRLRQIRGYKVVWSCCYSQFSDQVFKTSRQASLILNDSLDVKYVNLSEDQVSEAFYLLSLVIFF